MPCASRVAALSARMFQVLLWFLTVWHGCQTGRSQHVSSKMSDMCNDQNMMCDNRASDRTCASAREFTAELKQHEATRHMQCKQNKASQQESRQSLDKGSVVLIRGVCCINTDEAHGKDDTKMRSEEQPCNLSELECWICEQQHVHKCHKGMPTAHKPYVPSIVNGSAGPMC